MRHTLLNSGAAVVAALAALGGGAVNAQDAPYPPPQSAYRDQNYPPPQSAPDDQAYGADQQTYQEQLRQYQRQRREYERERREYDSQFAPPPPPPPPPGYDGPPPPAMAYGRDANVRTWAERIDRGVYRYDETLPFHDGPWIDGERSGRWYRERGCRLAGSGDELTPVCPGPDGRYRPVN